MTEDTRVNAEPEPDSGVDGRKPYEFSGLSRLGTLEKVTQTGLHSGGDSHTSS